MSSRADERRDAKGDEGEAANLARSIQASCVGVRVGHLHRLISRRFEAALRPLGLTLVQMEILTALTLVGEPVAPGVVAAQIGVERSTMSRNLKLMESRGLIRTTESSASERSLAVTIAPPGTEKLLAAGRAWATAQSSVVEEAGADVPSTIEGWIRSLGAAGPES